MQIAFLGLGIMGSRMAANLQQAGHSLTVHNRTRDKADELVASGASWASTPAAAVAGAPVVFTMLAHPEAVEAVALGADGFLDAMDEGALWVDSSTVHPSFSRRMAAEASDRGVRFVDAPVGGSKGAAASAGLIFIVGGAEEDIDSVRPLLEVMGQSVVHAGGVGQGTALKVVVNYLLATSMLAFGEGLVLGEALGIPRERLLDVLVGGPVAAPFLGAKREKLERGDFEAEFPLEWMQKDLRMVATAASEEGVALPLANLGKEMYQLAVASGAGREDFSAIYRFLRDTLAPSS